MKLLPVQHRYVVAVASTTDGWLAFLDEPCSPLHGTGSTPLEAIRSLCETIKEWPISGAERWLDGTPEGAALQRELVTGRTE